MLSFIVVLLLFPLFNVHVDPVRGQHLEVSRSRQRGNARAATGPDSELKSDCIHFLGRVDPARKVLSWPGTGFQFSFEGASTSITLTGIVNSSVVTIDVDGTIIPRLAVEQGFNNEDQTIEIIAQGNGPHHVVFRKVSEGKRGEFTLAGVKADGGIIPASTPRPARRIEFIGDSITVSYGVVVPKEKADCEIGVNGEDVLASYAVLTSVSLNADYSILACSGLGVSRNGGSLDPTMPHYFTRTVYSDKNDNTWGFPESSVPDAVVIALGTNDFTRTTYLQGKSTGNRSAVDIFEFKKAYIGLIESARRHYGNIPFFLCTSPMLSDTFPTMEEKQHTTLLHALKDIASSEGDELFTVVDFPPQDTNATDLGCDYHPGYSEHRRMSEILTPLIRKVMQWD